MGLPKQVGVKKDKDFCKRCVTAIVSMLGSVSYQKEKDRFCYDLYSGIMNEQDYNYLTKVDKYEYPAKLRFIPLIRPQLDYLRSEEARRPLNLRVFTVDQVSLQKKEDEMFRMMCETVHGNFVQRLTKIQNAISEIQQQIQPPQGQQAQPPNPQEQQQQKLAALKMALPNDMLQQTSTFTSKDIEKLETYMKYDYKDMIEEIMEKGAKYLIEKYNIKDKFTSGFEDKMVTDKEIYHVDWNGKDEDPQLDKVDLLNFYYSGDDDTEWIDECEWCAEIKFWTIPRVLDEFKDDLSAEDYSILEKQATLGSGNTNNYSSSYSGSTDRSLYNNSTDNKNNLLYAGTEDISNKIRVIFCFWQSPDVKRIKTTPNKYMEDTPFTHIMKDEDIVRKGEEVNEKFKNDIYRGVFIGESIYCRLGKKPVQTRGVDKPGVVGLPYTGLAFNNYGRRPYSLVWATREIQLLYNIIHYHKELWFALSGVKGFIMDKSQIPDGMSIKEWTYQRKLGVGWIQSVKEGRVQSTFNQFGTYDDTISPAIQYIDALLQNLEELARSITGVSRQRTGDIKPIERVGNTEASINQSAVITEILYYAHDRVKRRALSKLVNLCRKAWRKGKRAQYITGMFAQQILNIEPGALDEVDMDIFIGSSYKEDQALKEIRQVAFQDHAKNLLSMGQLTKLYSIDSLREMESVMEKYGELAEQKGQAGLQKSQDFEMKKMQLDGQLKEAADKAKLQFEPMWIKVEEMKLQLEREKFVGDQQVKEHKIASDEKVHGAKLNNDKQINDKAIDTKDKEIDVNSELRKVELELEKIKLSLEQKNIEKKDKQTA